MRSCEVLLVVLTITSAAQTVPRLGVFTEALAATQQHSNPFDVLCQVHIQGPSTSKRATMNVSMFYDGFATKVAPALPATPACTRKPLLVWERRRHHH